VSARTSFDFSEVCRAIARSSTPEELAHVIGGDPRRQKLADHLAAVVAAAPPITSEQRAATAAILRGGSR
jgi:hypothetical protein